MGVFIIFGGAGFIGSYLVEKLLSEGNRVVVADNLSTGTQRNVDLFTGHPGFSFHVHDTTVPFTYAGDVDAVVNLASPASPPDYLRRPIETLTVNSVGTLHTLELARKKGARYLLASTSEVYGDPLVHPQPETYWGNVNPVGPRSVYDESKRFAETAATAFREQYGTETRVARIFNTYGPRMRLDDGRVVTNMIGQALAGEPLTVYGDGTQTRSFCYATDTVDGLLRLLGSDYPHPVNIGNPAEITVRELADIIQQITGTHLPVEYRPLPQDDPKQRKPDITVARTELGWTPTVELRDGLARTFAHLRDENP
jgi:dTDP-glucose 4,6-dehydratase